MKKRNWLIWEGLILGSLFSAFFLFIFIGETLGTGLQALSGRDVFLLSFVFIGIIGTIVAWFRERIGAWLMIMGGLSFAILELMETGNFGSVSWFLLFILAGVSILLGLSKQQKTASA